MIVAAITGQTPQNRLPTHVELSGSLFGIYQDSVILLEQIQTIDKLRLRQRIWHLDKEKMDEIDHALEVSIGLSDNWQINM